jgi:osmotically-inducible protein OsmY
VQDSDIQKDIEQRLAILKASSIQVTVHDGVVTLAGRSSSEEEVQAVTLALQAKGAKDVMDKIEIQALNPHPRASSAKSQ